MQNIITRLNKLKVEPYNSLFDLIQKQDSLQKNIFHTIDKSIRYKDYPKTYFTTECFAELNLINIINILPYRYPGHAFPQFKTNPLKTSYSSLIIDTRGLKIKPMIFPTVMSQDGKEFYSKDYVNITYVHSQGITTYAYTDLEAKQQHLAGSHPYTTVAIKTINNCPVLAYNDIKRIFAHEDTRENLKQCKVIFIIDK